MNIFFLDEDPRVAAQMHCDKHLVKMIVETAQLLSTAHRLLTGVLVSASRNVPVYGVELIDEDYNYPIIGYKKVVKKFWQLPGEKLSISVSLVYNDDPSIPPKSKAKLTVKNQQCYKSTHANHPSNVWCRETGANYDWLSLLFGELLVEYTRRYGKIHQTAKLLPFLQQRPRVLAHGQFSQPTQAMPDVYKVEGDSVEAYRRYYIGEKARFARWTNREVPSWFLEHFKGEYDESHFVRTKDLDRATNQGA